MKLTSLYIADFGNLHDYKIDFQNNLYSAYEENGFGKSTLSLFIKSMFYGLKKGKKTDLSERIRAIPYSMPQCSGSIEFVYNGANYKIERVFYKNEADDVLKVYRNNKETDELGPVPGLIIFSIDEESFLKTISISANDLKIEPTESLRIKMGHYVESSDESVDYEKAKGKLETYKKTLVPSKGGEVKGLIAEKKKQIEDLENKKSNLNTLKDSLEFKYESLNKFSKDIADLEEKVNYASKINDILADWEMLDKYDSDIKGIKQNIDVIKSLYPFGIPNKDESEKVGKALNDNKQYLKEKEWYENNINNNELNRLKTHFGSSLPTDDELDSLNKLHQDYLDNSKKKESVLSVNDSDLINRFDYKDSLIDKLEEDIKKYRSFNQIAYNIPKDETPKAKKSHILEIVLLLLSIFLIILGLVISLTSKNYLLLLISGFGLLLLFVTGFIYFQKQLKDKFDSSSTSSIGGARIQNQNRLLSDISSSLSLLNYNVNDTYNIEEIISQYQNDLALYKSAKARQNEDKIGENKRIETLESITIQLQSFYKKYHYDGDLISNNKSLNEDVATYKRLMSQIKDNNDHLEPIDKQIKSNDETIFAFTDKYHVENIDEYLKALDKNRLLLSTKNDDLEKKQIEKEKFAKDKKLTTRPEAEKKIDTQDLNSQISKLKDDKSKLSNDIDDDERNIEALSNDVSSIETCKEELKELKTKEYIVKSTLAMLEEAEESLKNRYIAPLKNSFVKYISFLEETIGKKIVMNSDFEISIIEEGIQRDYRHLSSGQLTLVMLCYRLAILDNIFPNEKPFIIFDDAFTYLDEKHLLKANQLVKSLSSVRQILYFTCHKSREIK